MSVSAINVHGPAIFIFRLILLITFFTPVIYIASEILLIMKYLRHCWSVYIFCDLCKCYCISLKYKAYDVFRQLDSRV